MFGTSEMIYRATTPQHWFNFSNYNEFVQLAVMSKTPIDHWGMAIGIYESDSRLISQLFARCTINPGNLCMFLKRTNEWGDKQLLSAIKAVEENDTGDGGDFNHALFVNLEFDMFGKDNDE